MKKLLMNQKYLRLFIWVILSLPLATAAKDNSAHEADEKGRLRGLMHFFHSQIYEIRQYLNDDKQFQQPKALKELQAALTEMEKKTKSIPSEVIAKNPGYRLTFNLLSDHIARTKAAFDNKEYVHARLRFNATTNFCITCHTQTPTAKESLFGSWYNEDELKAATLANAEYLFIIRQFQDALNKYTELIRNYPKSKISPDELRLVYRRKLSIFSRVQRDPKVATESLKQDLGNDKLPADIRRSVEGWINSFEFWQKDGKDLSKASEADFLKFVQDVLGENIERSIGPEDPQLVNYLRVSGLLYERILNSGKSAVTPELLYYLGICEKKLSPLYWYSVSDVYWKECVVSFPKTPTAKKCFSAYEKSMLARSLRQGKPPEDVVNSIEALRQKITGQ